MPVYIEQVPTMKDGTPAIRYYPSAPYVPELQPDYELETSREGVAKLTVNYIGIYSTLQASYLASPKSPSGRFPSLLLYGSKVKRMRGQMGMLTLEYRGLDPNLNSPPPPIWSLQTNLSNEPIQTHPKWITDIAGTAQNPLNASIWLDVKGNTSIGAASPGGAALYYDSTGATIPASNFIPTGAAFKGWADQSIFAGVTDYLAPSTALTKTYTSYSPPDMAGVGHFATPGFSTALPAGYSWFFMGSSMTDEAGVYRIEDSWKLVPSPSVDGHDPSTIIYG